MCWRPLYGLLPLLAALGPLGCESGRHYRVKVETPFGVAWIGRPVEPDAAGKAGEGELREGQAARACLAAAERLAHEGRGAEAIAQFEQARELDPGVKVARRLAALYDREGQPERALAEYRRALREGPRDAALFNDLGYCYYRQGEYREAESWLRQAVAVNPASDRAWLHLGLVLGQEGRFEECCDAFARAVCPAPGKVGVAALLAEEGRLEEAKGSLRKALELEPGLQLAQVVLAVLEQSPAGAAPVKMAEAAPAAHFTISHKPSAKDEDGPWLPDLAE
jgi:tetratricopeptide (TPR) repeat protein